MIFMREVSGSYQALRMANAMEDAGAQVICVSGSGVPDRLLVEEDYGRHIVWARAESKTQMDDADERYDGGA